MRDRPWRRFDLFGWLILLVAGWAPLSWAQQSVSLRVGLGPLSVSQLPFMIALEENIYKKNGLDVDQFVSLATAQDAEADGVTVNPQYIGRGGAFPVIRSGDGAHMVFERIRDATAPENTIILATLEPTVRYYFVAQPDITRIEQLKGKRLGFHGPGGASEFAALILLERMRWEPGKDIALVEKGASVEALKNRRVEAISAGELRYIMATAAGFKSIEDTRSWKVPTAGTGVVASRLWLRDNRETARRFLRSLVQAIALMKKEKESAYRAMTKWWGITDAKRLETLYLAAAEIPRKPYPSKEGIEKATQVYASVAVRKYKPEDYYDDSFLRELDESGFIDRLYK